MEQSKKNFGKDDEEVRILKKIGQYIHTSFGYFIWITRLVSPLSHDDMRMDSSLNSCTTWRLEHLYNFSIFKFIEASYHYFKSIKCKFYIHRLCHQVESCIHSGKCLVVIAVDSSDLDKYAPKQIIFSQNSDDIEELKRRDSLRKKRLHIGGKLGERKSEKKSAKPSKPKKKIRK